MRSLVRYLRWTTALWWSIVSLFTSLWPFEEFINAADAPPIKIIEYRDTHPTIDVIEPIRILSDDKARELEGEIESGYKKLETSVVRLYIHDQQGHAFDDQGLATTGGVSGVIIARSGLILTCAHHRLAPGTLTTIELSNGKRVPGKILGSFVESCADLGLATITEAGDWPFAAMHERDSLANGQICLAIGYPGTLLPGRPPQLRLGRLLASSPNWPWLDSTTTSVAGDSGGPLFDLNGRVLGILSGTSGAGTSTKYESIEGLKDFRERLEAGEVVKTTPKPPIRVLRGRPSHIAAFSPAADIEDRVQQTTRNLIRILDGPHEIAAGLIVDQGGWAVTKASLLGPRTHCSCRVFYTQNGKTIVHGRIAAVSTQHDLALLKLDLVDWFPISWSPDRPGIGTFVSTLLGRTEPLQFAIVGAEASPELAKLNEIPQFPVSVRQDDSSAEAVVQQVGWNTAEFDAYRDLLQAGDVITHLNRIATPTRSDFGRVLDHLMYAPNATGDGVNYSTPLPGSFHGDWITVGIRRGTIEATVSLPLIHSTTMGGLTWYEQPLSLRRESFPMVFAHDFIVRPEQCGGPVVDLAGNVVGLNIARADQTRTLAIPSDVLQSVIEELRKEAERSEHKTQ